MADMTDIQTVLKQWPLNKLIALLLVFLLTIAGIGAMVWWAQSIDYQVLYSNLALDDASAVCDRLREMKIPYRLESGGTAVLVPASQVYDLRMELAAGGLPQGAGVGFEIFDESKFGMTEFLQKINFRRALQGELARTIGQLSEVTACRVHLSIPEKTIFTDHKEATKASVVVTLQSGRSLSRRQVQGVIRLVASSVEGLSPDHVTVLNSAGELLSSPSDEEDGAISASQAEYSRSLVRNYEQRVQSMLDGVLGPGKSIVRVDADIDFRRVERTEQKVDPDAVAVLAEQRTTEKSSGSTPGGGIPGVLSNTPGVPQGVAGRGSSSSAEKQNESVNYEVSKTVSRIVEPTGIIKKLSVAVMVDGSYKADDTGKEVYEPRSAEELKHLEDLVRTAVGVDLERGDRLVLTNIPFQRDKVEEPEEPGVDYAGYIPTIIKYLMPLAVVIFAFLFILKPLLTTVRSTPVLPSTSFPRSVSQLEGREDGGALLAGTAGTPTALPGTGGPSEVSELVRANPGQAAGIVKDWMGEE